MTPPRISILVPTYNRIADLTSCLERIASLEYPNLECIVIDDCSSDPQVQEVAYKYPWIRYHRLSRNSGLLAARNAGFKLCSGSYIVNLDDDSWFEDGSHLRLAIDFLEVDRKIAVLALNIRTSRGYSWPTDLPMFHVPYYVGCGNIYRRKSIAEVDPYFSEFIRQGEECDRTMQVMERGEVVVACPKWVVYHNESPLNRNVRRSLTFEVMNYFRREIIRAPLSAIPIGVVRASIYGFRRWHLIDWRLFTSTMFTGGASVWRVFLRRRKPVGWAAYLRWLSMSWSYARQRTVLSKYANSWRYYSS